MADEIRGISRPLYVVRQFCTGKIVNIVRLSPTLREKDSTEIKKAARAWMEADDQDKITIIYDTDDFFLQEITAYACRLLDDGREQARLMDGLIERIRTVCREYE